MVQLAEGPLEVADIHRQRRRLARPREGREGGEQDHAHGGHQVLHGDSPR
jgi:hypothetical protein